MKTLNGSETFYALVERGNKEKASDHNCVRIGTVKTYEQASIWVRSCKPGEIQVDYWNGHRWVPDVSCDQE